MNGNKYVGGFENGMKNIKGIEYDPNGKIIYEGEWYNDKYHGDG